MDVLSDAIIAMRTGRPHSSRHVKHAPWGTRFQPFAGAGFHVVLQGSCWLFPAQGAPIALSTGDVAFLPHGRGHGLADSADAELSGPADASLLPAGQGAVPTVQRPEMRRPDAAHATLLLCGGYLLDQSRVHPLLAELPEVIHLPARMGRHAALRSALDLLGLELEKPLPGGEAVLPALLDTLMMYILRAWFDEQVEQHGTTGWAAALNDPAVIAALRGIHREPARPWTVEGLGAQAGLSRAAFAKRFTALVGQPPLGYLTWWRITTAARLLRDTKAPLGSVATRVGYTSEFAFARAFKREYGVAPGEYRRRAHTTVDSLDTATAGLSA
jgi:AraC-like DNA-binding protein